VGLAQPKKRYNTLDAVGCAADGICHTIGSSSSLTKPAARAFAAKSGRT